MGCSVEGTQLRRQRHRQGRRPHGQAGDRDRRARERDTSTTDADGRALDAGARQADGGAGEGDPATADPDRAAVHGATRQVDRAAGQRDPTGHAHAAPGQGHRRQRHRRQSAGQRRGREPRAGEGHGRWRSRGAARPGPHGARGAAGRTAHGEAVEDLLGLFSAVAARGARRELAQRGDLAGTQEVAQPLPRRERRGRDARSHRVDLRDGPGVEVGQLGQGVGAALAAVDVHEDRLGAAGRVGRRVVCRVEVVRRRVAAVDQVARLGDVLLRLGQVGQALVVPRAGKLDRRAVEELLDAVERVAGHGRP